MTSPWRKVVRDLWQERTPLVVLAIAIGIAGCLAVLSAYAILTRGNWVEGFSKRIQPQPLCIRTLSTML